MARTMIKSYSEKHVAFGLRAVSVIAFFVVYAAFSGLLAANALGDTGTQVRHTIEFSQHELTFDKVLGYDAVRLGDGDYLSQLGGPMLPAREIRIALPSGMAAQTVRVVTSTIEEIDGRYDILPTQRPLKVGQTTDDLKLIEPNPDIYSSDDPYPLKSLELISQVDLAGQGMAVIKVCPLVYSPKLRKLQLYTSITFVIEGADGYICGDYLPLNISERGRLTYEQTVTNMVANKQSVSLAVSPFAGRLPALPSAGPFAHVIITSDANAPSWEPLVEWHTKKGLRDTIVTTSYIYANYSGSDNQDKIRAFVIDAHDNWGTLYFLIGGEHSTVPFEYRNYDGDNIPSDQYYGDYDNDWIYEVYVGRVSAEGSTQINTFINKLLKYEMDPPMDDYALKACLLGMDLTLASQPPYYTLTASEAMKEAIDNAYIPARFKVTEVYDSDPTNHRTDFINALNAGQNLVNHSDHSNYNVMGTGDLNHGLFIYTSHVNSLTNDGRLCNVFSLGCHPNEMDRNDCIAEYFVIYNELQAAVSFTGNTRSGWFYVGNAATLSGLLDMYWWRGLLMNNQYRLGEALAWTKNTCPHNSSYYYVQWTLNLLGEPAMPIWTDTIKTMVVTHSETFPVTASTFDVHVEKTTGGPVNMALVCLWKGDEIYETEYTDSFGDVSFEITPASLGDMYVTVTAQNFVPYPGKSECTGNLPPVAEFDFGPDNPTRHDTIQFNSSSYDVDGTVVAWHWDFGDSESGEGENVAHQYQDYGNFTVALAVEDNVGAGDTVQTQVSIIPICGDIDDSGADIDIADLTYLVDHMFNEGPEPPVAAAANIDGIPGLDIGDLVHLVDYMFTSGPAPSCTWPW
jgi:gingipain R